MLTSPLASVGHRSPGRGRVGDTTAEVVREHPGGRAALAEPATVDAVVRALRRTPRSADDGDPRLRAPPRGRRRRSDDPSVVKVVRRLDAAGRSTSAGPPSPATAPAREGASGVRCSTSASTLIGKRLPGPLPGAGGLPGSRNTEGLEQLRALENGATIAGRRSPRARWPSRSTLRPTWPRRRGPAVRARGEPSRGRPFVNRRAEHAGRNGPDGEVHLHHWRRDLVPGQGHRRLVDRPAPGEPRVPPSRSRSSTRISTSIPARCLPSSTGRSSSPTTAGSPTSTWATTSGSPRR